MAVNIQNVLKKRKFLYNTDDPSNAKQAKSQQILELKFRLRYRYEQRQVYLAQRTWKLQKRLAARPFDTRAILGLIDVLYERQDFLGSSMLIKKANKMEELVSSQLWVKLGRCHFRRWQRDRTKPDLTLSLEAYKKSLRPQTNEMSQPTSPRTKARGTLPSAIGDYKFDRNITYVYYILLCILIYIHHMPTHT